MEKRELHVNRKGSRSEKGSFWSSAECTHVKKLSKIIDHKKESDLSIIRRHTDLGSVHDLTKLE